MKPIEACDEILKLEANYLTVAQKTAQALKIAIETLEELKGWIENKDGFQIIDKALTAIERVFE